MDPTSDDDDERFRQAVVHAALRSVVHDLNNPLGTITMAAAALRTADTEAARTDLVELIEREAMRAGATARAAADGTAVGPRPAPTSLQDLVAAVRGSCRAIGVEASIADPDAAGVVVFADPALLPPAVTAFVVDAHFSPGRREPVSVRWQSDDVALEVVIHDDGQAVAPERARRPFRPFVSDGEVPGRAIGLHVAAGRYHVRSIGGSTELQPGAAGGNTVRLRLPLAVGAPTSRAGASMPASDPTGREPTPVRHVLVVDDDRTMRDMLEVVLRRAGWETSAAADGRAAADAVRERPIDLVLLDLHLGTEHGPDIAAQLEAAHPGLARRVVYLSGDVPPSGRIDDRPAIAKPFVLDELYRVADAVVSAAGPL